MTHGQNSSRGEVAVRRAHARAAESPGRPFSRSCMEQDSQCDELSSAVANAYRAETATTNAVCFDCYGRWGKQMRSLTASMLRATCRNPLHCGPPLPRKLRPLAAEAETHDCHRSG